MEVMLDGLLGCACYTLDPAGVVTSWNEAAERMHGFAAGAVVGRHTSVLALPDPDAEDGAEDAVLAAAVANGRAHHESPRVRADGSTFWANVAVTALRDDAGGLLGFVVITQDLTEQLAATERWRTAHARSAALLEHWRGAAAVVDLAGVVTYATPALAALAGVPVDAVVGRPLTELVRTTDVVRLRDLLGTVDEPHARATVVVGLQSGTELGAEVELELVNRRDDVHIDGIVVNAYDRTERVAAEARSEWEKEHDGLTKLANRRFLVDRLTHPRAADADLTFGALLLVDIDHFRTVNDTVGHNESDRVLVELADRLRQVVRLGDEVVRVDGDRFAVLVEEAIDTADAVALADRIRAVASDPITGVEGLSSLTVSVGVALGGDSHRTELLAAAEAAVKRAKDLGRDRTVVFEPALRAEAHQRVETEHSLRHALEAGAMIVHYQPVVDLATERVVGAEALLRIRDADGRAHLPTHLINVAEETGLIVPIGIMVIEHACRQVVAWRRDLGPLAPAKVAVNVAPRQWATPGFATHVEHILRDHELDASVLCLEITESAQIAADDVVATNMRLLRERGVRFALDDFGAGHAALNYLTRFDADVVKIDKGFVDDVVTNRSQEIIVNTIIDMAISLGLEVIAEGIEDADQRDVLRELGCHQGQGWLWHKAVTGAEFADYVRSQAAVAGGGAEGDDRGSAEGHGDASAA